MENKNTPNKLWFKAKTFGWGWYPVTWQGYLVTLVYGICIGAVAYRAVIITENTTNNASTFLYNYLPLLGLLSFFMIWICYKTGEKPKWQWNWKNR